MAWPESKSVPLLKGLSIVSTFSQRLCESCPKYGSKSTNNIQMVPRLSSQLCTKEWQVQQNHVEFFTLCNCLFTLTPSWAFSARPELCQAYSDTNQLQQQAWPGQNTMQSLIHSFILKQNKQKMTLGCIVQRIVTVAKRTHYSQKTLALHCNVLMDSVN